MFAKLIWADRVIVFWTALVCLFFFFLGGAASVKGLLTYPYAMFVLIGIPWLMLRVFDLCVTGHVRLIAVPPRPRRPDIVVMPPPQARPLVPRDIAPNSRAPSGLRE
jgi:hypothetical protein